MFVVQLTHCQIQGVARKWLLHNHIVAHSLSLVTPPGVHQETTQTKGDLENLHPESSETFVPRNKQLGHLLELMMVAYTTELRAERERER